MVRYQIRFSKQAEKDKARLKAAGFEKKAKELLTLIQENPFQTPPRYEKLVGNLAGSYSRRINIQHRLVYDVLDNTIGLSDANGIPFQGIILILRMWTHYE